MRAIFLQRRIPFAGAIAGSFLTLALSAEAFAMPAAPAVDSGVQAQVIDVKYNRRRAYRGGGGAGAAAVLGVLALGIGAAIANSNMDDQYYPSYDYPAYGYPAYGYPDQGYGYAQPRYQAPQRIYRGRAAPRYQGGTGTYWQQKNRQDRENGK